MNLGLESFLPPVLYAAFWVALLASIFWRPIAGIYYLVPLIPAQTLRARLGEFPLGDNVVILILLAVSIGILTRRQSLIPRTSWTAPLTIYIAFTFVSLCLGSLYLGRPLFVIDDLRTQDWRNYVAMLYMLFLVAAAVTTTKEIKIVVALMCVSVFLVDKSFWNTVSGRDFSTYSDDLRDEGSMGYAGVNGLAAFEAQVSMFLIAIGANQRERIARWGCYALAAFSSICLMYSLSRAGYVAILAGWLFLGAVKYRKLLVLLILFGIFWTALVPPAVRERVEMTYDDQSQELDHSSETRLTLWEDAMQLFSTNPVTGTGFDTYAFLKRVDDYRDTHNIYLKVLVETGIVGMLLFLWLLWRTFWSGFRLFRSAADDFHSALGLGLAAWLICSMTANLFGDRWTYLQVNGFLWVIAGLVARAWIIEEERATIEASADESEYDSIAELRPAGVV